MSSNTFFNGFQPVIIIGAPRSGTNMLRDILTSFAGVASWPCDEINYIWRHGNVFYPSDEIGVEKASPSIKMYIRRCFQSISNKYNADVVVEKTCANSLRLPFVNEVLPEAKYIFIYRDGIDATGSAALRWTAKVDLPYLFEKVRYVPKSDLPYYAFRYMWSRLYRLFSNDGRLAFWGPTIENMQEVARGRCLNEICALQWQRCVELSEQTLSKMPENQVIRVCYETFVTNPEEELERILRFLGKSISEGGIKNAVSGVSCDSLGKGRKALGQEEVAKLEALVGGTLKRYGYL